MGVLWIFVLGDNPWPTWVENTLPLFFGAVFVVVWLGLLAAGYIIGKRQEAQPALNKMHVLVSAAVTIVCILFILAYQLGVGNLGPKTDSTVCSEFCSQKGYPASSMPPQNTGDRSCSCLDSTGHAIITVPVDSIQPQK